MVDSADYTDSVHLRKVLEGLRGDPDVLIGIILRQVEQIRRLTDRVEEGDIACT